jgi:predicted unusual protein kinase regulating ubiquinone biosynthesis (AarF/ABC1/UbiB family)
MAHTMGDDQKKLSTGRLARLAKLASMSARLSTDVVSRGVKRFTGSPAGGPESLLGAGAAEKLVATLGDLKGLAMKIGQQVSMDPDLLTPEVRAVVARLQNQAPPMPWETVRQVLREGLGREPAEAFERVEEVPLASASLGQVHRAWTKGGEEVAVKVQYPDIGHALQSDLDNIGSMVSVFAGGRMAHGRGYYTELRETLLDELDYRREAERAKTYALAAAPLTDLVVPRVYDELTSEKVLTLEFLAGRTVKDVFGHLEQTTPELRFRASRQLIRAIWGPFLLSGLIHADPHPGNFMVLGDGRLGVLDFGAVKQISPEWADVNRRMLRALCRGETFDGLALSLEAGFRFEDHAAARPFVETIVDIGTRPLRTRDFDYKTAFVNRDMRNHFIKSAPKLPGMKPPKEAVQFFRAVGGLSQNLENLGARGDFRAVWEELLVLSPPSSR